MFDECRQWDSAPLHQHQTAFDRFAYAACCCMPCMNLHPSMRSYVDGLHLPPSHMLELVTILNTAGVLEGPVCTRLDP